MSHNAAESGCNMAFPVAAALMGGANLLGGYMTNQANSAEASANRNWQAMMSNTAHQREVQDLRAAGLNPILSALGNGASTPSGGMATMQNPVEGAISSAQQARQLNSQLELNQKEGEVKDATKKATIANTIATETNNRLTHSTMPFLIQKAKAEAESAQTEADWKERNMWINAITSGVSSAAQVVGAGALLKNSLRTVPEFPIPSQRKIKMRQNAPATGKEAADVYIKP